MSTNQKMSLLSRKLAAAATLPLTTLPKPFSQTSFSNQYNAPSFQNREQVEECEKPYMSEEVFNASSDLTDAQSFNAASCQSSLAANNGATSTRGTKLYQKLQLLMADKPGSEPLLARSPVKKPKSLPKPQEPEARSSGAMSSVVMPQPVLSAKSSETNVRKTNSLYSSLAKIEGNFSKVTLDKLIEKGNKKRTKKTISPQISKARFTLQEDQIIAHHYATLGANWKKITTYLPGKTEDMVKNRYFASIKNKQSCETLAETASAQSSENRMMTQSSEESGSFFDDLSEQMTGKYSEPEPNSASVKKNADFSVDFFGQMESTGLDFMDKNTGAANFTDNNSFLMSPAFGPVTENKAQEFWEPIDFGNDHSKFRRFSAEFLGFDQASYGQEVNQGLNLFAQDNFCENLLNFKEDNTFAREHPLAPIEQANNNKASDVAMEEEFDSLFAEPVKQDQIAKAAEEKLNQLQFLVSQIRSIEQLFDRTKQELGLLQNRFVAN